MMSKRFGSSLTAHNDTMRFRVIIVALALVCWMLIIGIRLVHLQTFQHDWLTEYARTQQQILVETDAVRGPILDRAGRELARTIDSDSVFAVPGEIKDIKSASIKLAGILKADPDELFDKLQNGEKAKRKFIWIARKLEADQAALIKSLKLTGIHIIKEPKRRYPHGTLAAHILGFVGLDDVGLSGIEQSKNASLTGKVGQVFIDKDGRRREYGSDEFQAFAGKSIVLTIDQTIQYWTEQSLNEAVRRSQARSGTAIVLNPRNGEILALANVPTFDPNIANKLSSKERANEALQNIYEPGSTFKIVAYSAAIEKSGAKPNDFIDCQMGVIDIAGRIVNDHHPYNTLTLTDALAKSSNVAAIKLGMRVGNETMYQYIRRFGFGSRTGIELPGESAGLLRSVEDWHPSSIGSIAIGQEIGVTPIQMVSAFGILANDGVRTSPHLVREVRSSEGMVLSTASPKQERVVSVQTATALRGMLESVTLKGTAKLAQVDGYSAAGKTGTAQKIDPRTKAYSKTKYVASFVGFAPVKNPSVVILVVIDEPKGAYYGGEVAAPVFRDIAERVLPVLGIAPDLQFNSVDQFIARSNDISSENWNNRKKLLPTVVQSSTKAEEIVYAASNGKALIMPDLKGKSVRDVANICAQLGLQLKANGDGQAMSQMPTAGASVKAGQIVQVKFNH
jgi:cell division protein FtsI (penicillin-binding protein 3)